jgi:DNA-binding NtrC family response regulator
MVFSSRKRILVFHPDRPMLQAYATLLKRHGYEVVAADSVVQMVLKLQAEEDSFDLLLVECSNALKESPSNFVRFVKETQACSLSALMVNGIGANEVLDAGTTEGVPVMLTPKDIAHLLSVITIVLDGGGARLAREASA